MDCSYRIMVIGASWHGSNCTGLARAFRELGHTVELLGTDQFFPKNDGSIPARALRRALTKNYASQYNKHILKQVLRLRPDFVVVFKGSYVKPSTLKAIRDCNIWLCNFYPDVSFLCHKTVDPSGFKFYDHIFTTKSFGLYDFESKLGLSNVSFLPHGYDPLVHRPLLGSPSDSVDASFIGTWSPHKQTLLEALGSDIDLGKLRIWGDQWEMASSGLLSSAIAGHGVMGDFYARAISATKINLGLLSEVRTGASSGDHITSRTFHIPACGGFLLHERTDEVLEYYVEDREIACFDSSEELVDKVKYYLENDEIRRKIAKAGYERCIREYSLKARSQKIIAKYPLKYSQG